MPSALVWLWMLLPFALWGTAMAAMTPLVTSGGPWLVAGLRLLPAGVVLMLSLPLLGRSWQVRRADWVWLLVFTLVDGTVFQALLARGLVGTGAGLGSVLIDSQPLLVALLARLLFGEAINPIGWFGLLLGLAGILCLGVPERLLGQWWLQGPPEPIGLTGRQGVPWMLGAAVAMALGTVLSRYASRHSDPVAVTAWHMLLGSLPLLALHAAVTAEGSAGVWSLPPWTAGDWALMAYASLLGGALAYGLFFWFANRRDLTSFTSLTFLTPVFALLSGVSLLGERLKPLQWLGVLLALVAVVLINRRRQLWRGPVAGSDGAMSLPGGP
jgi:drug/metabolite transporter (DMT)-like permease